MQGVDISVLHVNVQDGSSYIVDGAARVGALVKFYQGSLPMVVTYANMPDNVVFRPYAVPEEQYKHDRFRYKHETLVQAYYSGLPASMKCSFLDAQVGIVKLQNLGTEQEQHVHWQNNCMCPSSPIYPIYGNVYDETAGFEDVASRMHHTQVQRLSRVLSVIEDSMDQSRAIVARAEVLGFARSMLSETETDTAITTSSSISTSTSEVESDEETLGAEIV
jgi:hypothetical protein